MLRRSSRSFVALAGAALAMGMLPSAVARAATTPTTYTIGVDNASPSGHNFEYSDFFPRDSVNIHSGDVLNFAWNPGSADGFHTVTVLPTTQTEAQARQANPLFIPDSDDGGGKTVFNPSVVNPTAPPTQSGAPGACGDTSAPCTYDGSKMVNSGGMPTNFGNGMGPSFAVKVTAPAGSYTAICLIHANMHQSFTVVADAATASTPAEVQSAASSQYNSDTSDALTAEGGVHSTTTVNPDGTRTLTEQAGLNTAHVDIDEMLPSGLAIHPGDKVTWTGSFIHTVTFPQGSGSSSVDPFNGECESASGPDAPATGGPPDGGCAGGPPAFEQTFDPSPHGPTSIRKGGYVLGASDGGVFTFGNSHYFGSASQFHLAAPIVATVTTPDGGGYYQVGSDGGIFSFGDAPFFGSAAKAAKSAPIVAMLDSPFNDGYVLLGADGKMYPFGNVPPGIANALPKLAAPAVGLTTSPSFNGPGVLVAAADGGVFNVGAAPFFGSAGNIHLAKPVVGIAVTPDGGGYWLVASDGGVFSYGDARFFGSTGAMHLNAPIVGITPTASGNGYQLVAADGGIFDFGDALFQGSTGNLKLVSPVNSIAPVVGTVASSGVIGPPGGPFPSNYTFSFPETGTFTYQCRIHDHMRGVISSS